MRHGEAGYSLVELLVVLALLGLIAVAISGGMSFGTRAWERTESEVAGTEAARGGHTLLRNLLSRIYPRRPGLADEGAAFTGDARRMEFAADAPSSDAGVSRMALSIRQERDVFSLVLEQGKGGGSDKSREDLVITGASRVGFSYAQVSDGMVVWNDTWQATDQIPALIRIRVSMPAGRRPWPDLIVRPRIDRAANCIYDPVSFDCRRG
jgi:general secretion pathway protein J